MDSSLGSSFIAVFAVSGSVVLLSMQLHKRLLSNFMKRMEFEIKNSTGNVKEGPKKKVRFADDATESTADIKAIGGKYMGKPAGLGDGLNNDENLEAMPLNWQVMYKGILRHKNLRGV